MNTDLQNSTNISEIRYVNITDNKITNSSNDEMFTVDFRQYYKYGFEFILYGYFMPVWTSMCIMMYILMITVFLRYGMTTKTHVCLIAIAICDSLSPIAPTSAWVFFFAIKKNFYYLPFEYCKIYHYATEVIPQLFTYTSYFITIMMTVHRYILVAHPFKADKLCSKTVVYVMIIVCFVTSVAIRMVHFFHYAYISTTVPAQGNVNETMEACSYGRANWIPISLFKYMGTLMTVQTILVGFIPCTILVVSEILMVKNINYRSAKREKMKSNPNGTQTKTAQNERRLTVTTIIITMVTLSYMVPVVVIQLVDVAVMMFNAHVADYNDLRTTVVILNVYYWMCIPSNFIITCCLSREFRQGIRRLFVAPEKIHTTISSSVSLANTRTITVD